MNCNIILPNFSRVKLIRLFSNISVIRIMPPKYLKRYEVRDSFSSYFTCSSYYSKLNRRKDGESLYQPSIRLSCFPELPSKICSCHFHLNYILYKESTEDISEDKKKGDKKSSLLEANLGIDEKLSLFQKFKLMYKQYWYVLIPVHVATSIVWFGCFFFAAKSGMDVNSVLEKIGISTHYLRDSNVGYYGIAYALYKIATPARYTVTLGGTTVAINYLKNRGYIKPVPTKEELKVMYEDKKDELKEKKEEMREKYQEKKEEMKEIYQEKVDEFYEKYQDKAGEVRGKYHERRSHLFEKYGLGKKKDSKDSNDKNKR